MSALLELTGLEIRFGGLRAVAGLDLSVAPGAVHALIGPNGAGKSTVLNAISRFVTPAAGAMRFGGESLLSSRPHQVAQRGIGRSFQNIELCGQLSALDNVLIGMSTHIAERNPFWPSPARLRNERRERDEAMRVLGRVGLGEFADRPARQLDFGRQKLLDLARALACRPRLLLLDEPAAGLRASEIRMLDALLVDLVRRDGLAILLVEHVMPLVMSIAERITVLNFGEKIAEGKPEEIRRDPRVIEAYLGRGVDASD